MLDSGLNPYSGDYTGERINDLANAVYLRLMTPLGSYWADKKLGSRLHELAREKDLPRVRKLAVQYAQSALEPLKTSGRAKSIQVNAVDAPKSPDGSGRMLLLIAVEDNTSRQQTFRHYVRVI